MGKKDNTTTVCQNCGATLIGAYCHVCSQAAKEPRRAVIGLVQDVFVETLAIDGKLFRTLFLLLIAPATLARRYLDGKRVRYSPPFRLYLFSSVFFFFALFLLVGQPGRDISAGAELDLVTVDEITDAGADQSPGVDEAAEENASDAEEAESDEGLSYKDRPWSDDIYNGPEWLKPHAQRLYEAGQRVIDDPRLFLAEARQNIPRVLLLAPVVYGIILTLLYFYRRKYYVFDHFIVSLYMHAALYAYLLLAILFSHVPGVSSILVAVTVIWAGLQPILVFRGAYGSNWISVIGKSIISISIYLAAWALIITLGLSIALYNS